MIIPKLSKTEKLKYFQDLYQEARNYAENEYEAMDKHAKQYKGEVDDSEITATRNITYELIESQISPNIPTASVHAKMWSEHNERNAKTIETLLSCKRDELPYEELNDIDERFSNTYGGSVYLSEWDDSITTHNSVGDVTVAMYAPKRFTCQPNIYNVRDAEYVFLEYETTKDEIVRRYGVKPSVAEETQTDTGSTDDKTATLYVCYYKNTDDVVCRFIWSGDVILSDIDDFYARKRRFCTICGKREELCECEEPKYELENEEYEELDHDIVRSDGTIIPMMSPVIENGQPVFETKTIQEKDSLGQPVFNNVGGVLVPKMVDVQVPKMERTKLPWYKPKSIPVVIRKNISEEDKLFGQSDCAAIKPQQEMINKIETRIAQKLLKSGVTPVIPEDAVIVTNNAVFDKVIKLRAGENKNLYGIIDTQPNIQQDIAQSDRLYDQAKRILGISDSYMGQHDSSAQSGVAKQIQVQQSAGRMDSKRQMKHAAYANLDRIIFELYLAFADEPRPATYKDSFGKMQNRAFNRYDFLERDENGDWYYNDEYTFSTDASADYERSRTFIWQENRQNFQSGAYGDPALPETMLIFWQGMEKAHYPNARDYVERFSAIVEAQQKAMQQQTQGGVK